MALGKRRHLYGVVGDKGRLNVATLAFFAENLVYEFAFAHGLIHLDAEVFTCLAECGLVHSRYIHACMVFDGLRHGYTREWCFETDDIVAHTHLVRSVDVTTYTFKQVLGEGHHPVVVLVGYIYLHTCEFGIVRAIHAFVAEVLGKLIHAVKPSHDKSLEV